MAVMLEYPDLQNFPQGEVPGIEPDILTNTIVTSYSEDLLKLAGESDAQSILNYLDIESGTTIRLGFAASQVNSLHATENPGQIGIIFNEPVTGTEEKQTKDKVVVIAIAATSVAVSAAAIGAYIAKGNKKKHS